MGHMRTPGMRNNHVLFQIPGLPCACTLPASSALDSCGMEEQETPSAMREVYACHESTKLLCRRCDVAMRTDFHVHQGGHTRGMVLTACGGGRAIVELVLRHKHFYGAQGSVVRAC
jgi:hypothetical protein